MNDKEFGLKVIELRHELEFPLISQAENIGKLARELLTEVCGAILDSPLIIDRFEPVEDEGLPGFKVTL